MKVQFIFVLLVASTFSSVSFSQSAFRKKYFVPESVSNSGSTQNVRKKPSEKIDLSAPANTSPLQVGTYTSSTKKFVPSGNYSFSGLSITKKRNRANYKWKLKPSKKGEYIKANVKFVGKHLFVNPWYFSGDLNRDKDIVFELDNRQNIKLSYQQWTVSPITVPLKMQFGKDDRTNYSAGIALGGLFGYSWGRTSFTYRKNIDNFQRSHEFTLGGVISFQGIEIAREIEDDKVKTTSTSLGIGMIYSYDKLNFGLVGGIEFANGFAASQWNYDQQPWLGVLIGYSIFD